MPSSSSFVLSRNGLRPCGGADSGRGGEATGFDGAVFSRSVRAIVAGPADSLLCRAG